jgi:hypothetical protein
LALPRKPGGNGSFANASTASTREPVILDDASANAGGFASDPYFTRSSTRSVLCLPIVRQDLDKVTALGLEALRKPFQLEELLGVVKRFCCPSRDPET